MQTCPVRRFEQPLKQTLVGIDGSGKPLQASAEAALAHGAIALPRVAVVRPTGLLHNGCNRAYGFLQLAARAAVADVPVRTAQNKVAFLLSQDLHIEIVHAQATITHCGAWSFDHEGQRQDEQQGIELVVL